MKQLLIFPLVFGLFIFLVQSCSEAPVPESGDTVILDQSTAIYEDLNGIYTLELEGDGTILKMEFPASANGIMYENPVPETGFYSIDALDLNHIINVISWSDETGNQQISDAMVSVISEEGSCTLDGTLVSSDKSTKLHFKTNEISFAHTVTRTIDVHNAVSEYSENEFILSLYGNNTELKLVLIPETITDTLHIPDGEYSYVDGSVLSGSCILSDDSGDHNVKDIWVEIFRKDGGYMLYGIVTFEDNTYARFSFKGTIYSADTFSSQIFLDLGGEWNMSTDSWLVYNADNSAWEYSDIGDTYSMSMSGIPDYNCFLSTGLFDSSFSFLTYFDDEGLFIPCSVTSNPIAIVQSGSGSFYLFATLYDPETGYFMSGNNAVPIALSDDLSHFDVMACETEVTDDNGEHINVSYTYFGLIGRKTTSNTYSMFSNWPFLRLPVFSRPGTDGVPSSFQAMKLEEGSENIKVSETIVDDGTLRIIPISNRQL